MINIVIVKGNLTKDPELRYTPSGTPITSFSIASNRKWKSGEEAKEEVSFFEVVVFGRSGENVAQYVHKGSPVLVHGRLQQQRWETDDGSKRSKVQIVAEWVEFLGSKGGQEEGY